MTSRKKTSFASETHVQPSGAIVEVGTVTHEGRSFAALGSVQDAANGNVFAYVSSNNGDGLYWLVTWEGKIIAPLRLVRRWCQRGFYGSRVELWAWACMIDGKVFHGRNAGPSMFIRMRARVS